MGAPLLRGRGRPKQRRHDRADGVKGRTWSTSALAAEPASRSACFRSATEKLPLVDVRYPATTARRDQPLVASPQPRTTHQHRRAEQVSVHRAQSTAPEPTAFDERDHLGMAQHGELVKTAQQLEDHGALPDRSECQLLDHQGVSPCGVLAQQVDQSRVASVEMVDPRRGVDQYHSTMSRRRGATEASGSDPPSAASRLALSTRISIANPSRRRVDRSTIPVSSGRGSPATSRPHRASLRRRPLRCRRPSGPGSRCAAALS